MACSVFRMRCGAQVDRCPVQWLCLLSRGYQFRKFRRPAAVPFGHYEFNMCLYITRTPSLCTMHPSSYCHAKQESSPTPSPSLPTVRCCFHPKRKKKVSRVANRPMEEKACYSTDVQGVDLHSDTLGAAAPLSHLRGMILVSPVCLTLAHDEATHACLSHVGAHSLMMTA